MNNGRHLYTSIEGATPDQIHKSIGVPIRALMFVLLTTIWIVFFLGRYGTAGFGNPSALAMLVVGLALIATGVPGLRVAAQWEKGVILQLGKYVGVRGPGVFYVVPGLESVLFVDTRLVTLDIPAQRAITKDNVPVQIDGALFFQVFDPGRAVVEVQDYRSATSQYAQAALRDMVGGLSLDELLGERERIQESVRNILEARTEALGIHVDSVRLLDVDVPEDLKRMMSRQASAEREKRATITKAEGDKLAALNLSEAASTMLTSPGAMQLRTLQTIDGLGSSPSNTVLLFPVDLMNLIKGVQTEGGGISPELIAALNPKLLQSKD